MEHHRHSQYAARRPCAQQVSLHSGLSNTTRTVLHLLGLDHEKLAYRYAGRDFRLTDVYGNVVRDVIA